MLFHEFAQIHAVKLIAWKNYVMGWFLRFKVNEVFAYGIGSSFIPAGMFQCLFCCKNFNKSPWKAVKVIGIRNVQVQGSRIKLCYKINFFVTWIDTVWNWNIYNAVSSSKRNCWFWTFLCKRIKSGSFSTAQNYCCYADVINFCHLIPLF